jgi:hypothetical protein
VIAPDSTTVIAFALWGVLTVSAVWAARSRTESAGIHAAVY